MSPVALAFAVLSVSRSPAALGLVLAAQLAPEALLVLLGGVIADRTDRRLLMVTTDVARLLLQGASAGLLLAHAATLVELVVLQAGLRRRHRLLRSSVAGLSVPAGAR